MSSPARGQKLGRRSYGAILRVALYRQAGSGTRYYHLSYGHASRLGCNESSDNSPTPPLSPQPTKDSEFSTTFSPDLNEALNQHYDVSLNMQLAKPP
ncbi:hypothetical protein Y032_0447g1611 [Ancylostoma ceylanicum]|uniref:Uncharacterized protein n=1 Tax=Ancylostoma ceylanicum TaxID=53326 RepID=A0A016X0P9_9BILA|nr:hypothetical protein Y032_0447g1611 [Ancylostoma ceylanicum]